ncbi:hypothetical protein ACQR2B_27950 [Bradyrhizobium oligotrophicum]|uniref:hypothetical protein n=1 Tax=Bradyrhizobium TaxID=374 RepID=UPI003EBF8F7B
MDIRNPPCDADCIAITKVVQIEAAATMGKRSDDGIVTSSGGWLANAAATLSTTISDPKTSTLIVKVAPHLKNIVADTISEFTSLEAPGSKPASKAIAAPAKPRAARKADRAAPEPVKPVTAEPATIPVAAHFKLVFWSVLVLTLLVSVAFVALAVFVKDPTAGQTAAMETTRTLAVAGFGAIVGLLGGKSIQ